MAMEVRMIDNRVFGRETQLRIGKRAVIRNVWWTGRAEVLASQRQGD